MNLLIQRIEWNWENSYEKFNLYKLTLNWKLQSSAQFCYKQTCWENLNRNFHKISFLKIPKYLINVGIIDQQKFIYYN